jgi:polar amino acid transport system substrate-binding protein
MKKLIIFTLAILISLSSFSFGKTISVTTDPWPPFADPANPDHGLVLQIVKQAYKLEGIDVSFTYLPWARAIKMVEKKKYDVLACVWKTPEREKIFEYSDVILTNKLRLIKSEESDFTFSGDLKELSEMRIGVIRGYSYNNEFDNATFFIREPVRDIMMNIKKLLVGRVNLTIADDLVARIAISRSRPDLFIRLRFLDPPIAENDLHIVSAKGKEGRDLISTFNSGLRKLDESGDLQRIMDSYTRGN